MKRFNYISLIFFFLSLNACKDDGPEIEEMPSDKIAFTYEVAGDFKEDFYIGSEIRFENKSAVSGTCTWDFGDGTISNEANPVHRYQKADTYVVALTIEGEGTLKRKLLVSDIFPTLTSICSDAICEVGKSTIEIEVFLPNPQNLEVDYEWILPEGTLNQEGEEIRSFHGENPGTLSFRHVGSQQVILKTKLGGRILEEGAINVQVGYDKPVKTLYYAVKDGNLMAYKLIDDAPQEMKIAPFNLGVKSGNMPMNLLCDDSLIYVLDAGKQFKYVDDKDGNLGDGKLSVVSKDGKIVETLFTNNGGHAYNDPFFGYLDPIAKNIYVTDRNTGITRFSTLDRNLQMSRDKYGYFVQNDRLDYYNAGNMIYGAINACITKMNDVWYWCKTYNGLGIYRFRDTDIKKDAVTAGVKDKPYPILLTGCYVKSLAFDQKNNLAFFVLRAGSQPTAGLYVAHIEDFNTLTDGKTMMDAIAAGKCVLAAAFDADDLGSAGEFVDVCQIASDPETATVYLGLRAGSGSAKSTALYRCRVKDPSQLIPSNIVMTPILENIQVLGVTINHQKSKLF